MRKKYWIIVIIIIFGLSGCSYQGEKLFTGELCKEITEVRYMDFRGYATSYSDNDSISLVANALESGTYEKIPEENYVEGSYSFIFIADGKEYKFGYSGSDIIAYEGAQYVIHNNKFDKLLSLVP